MTPKCQTPHPSLSPRGEGRVRGCLELELGIYLGFGFWNLGFQAYAIHC